MSAAIVVLAVGFLILVHEGGHFLVARQASIPIARFSIGFGPKLISFQWGETEVRLSLIPLGGYVLPAVQDMKEYFQLPLGRRILFALGGPAANLILPLLFFALANVAAGHFSAQALLLDPILDTGRAVGAVLAAIPGLFSRPDSVAGVVGIVVEGGKIVESGWTRAFQFLGFLSVNFAIFNLLPVPILDGGKVVLGVMEKVWPRSVRYYVPASLAGLAVLVGFLVFTLVVDIARYAA